MALEIDGQIVCFFGIKGTLQIAVGGAGQLQWRMKAGESRSHAPRLKTLRMFVFNEFLSHNLLQQLWALEVMRFGFLDGPQSSES